MSDVTGGCLGESAPLTSAEAHVLEMVADDYSNSEIAEVLVCSPETVKSHMSHILRKLGVSGPAGGRPAVASKGSPETGDSNAWRALGHYVATIVDHNKRT